MNVLNEIETRKNIWINSEKLRRDISAEEIKAYDSLSKSHWFSPLFQDWLFYSVKNTTLTHQLRTQLSKVERKAEIDINIRDEYISIALEASRLDLINRNGDLI